MIEKRRYSRYHIDTGMLISDDDLIIGLARVIDISNGGFSCVGLSPIKYLNGWIDGIDLYDPSTDTSLQQLRGRMKRYSINKNSTTANASTISYFVGFEASPDCISQITNFKELLCKNRIASSINDPEFTGRTEQ